MFTWVGELRHLQSLGKVGGGVIELQQLEELQLRPCPLHAGAEAVGQRGKQGPQSLNQQHSYHLVGVLENLQQKRGICVSTQDQRGAYLQKSSLLDCSQRNPSKSWKVAWSRAVSPKWSLPQTQTSSESQVTGRTHNLSRTIGYFTSVTGPKSITRSIYLDGHPKLAGEDCEDDSAETESVWEEGNKMELKKSNSLSQGWRTFSQICRPAHSHLSP